MRTAQSNRPLKIKMFTKLPTYALTYFSKTSDEIGRSSHETQFFNQRDLSIDTLFSLQHLSVHQQTDAPRLTALRNCNLQLQFVTFIKNCFLINVLNARFIS